MKVELDATPDVSWHAPGFSTKVARRSLPFYKSRRGQYIHRVRSLHHHWRDGKFSHAWVKFWCGNSGFLDGKGYLMAKIPADGVLCATCEGRVIGAGAVGSRTINGRPVMYSPRKQNDT